MLKVFFLIVSKSENKMHSIIKNKFQGYFIRNRLIPTFLISKYFVFIYTLVRANILFLYKYYSWFSQRIQSETATN